MCSHDDENTGLPTFQIQDGVQNRLLLGCAKRNVLVATFIGIIYSNMGGRICICKLSTKTEKNEVFEAKCVVRRFCITREVC